jgi:hypothetical protein
MTELILYPIADPSTTAASTGRASPSASREAQKNLSCSGDRSAPEHRFPPTVPTWRGQNALLKKIRLVCP